MKTEQILIKPIVTEKATASVAKSVYTFEVSKKASKNQIKQALEAIYKVKIQKVTISNRKGKTKRTGKRMIARTMPTKKIAHAFVTEGKIDVFPQS